MIDIMIIWEVVLFYFFWWKLPTIVYILSKRMQEEAPLVIGYYPFRAKGQVGRLICEYLHVPYTDRFFTPDQWNLFR